MVSADCENPLAAFLVLDYLCGKDISRTNRTGKQGVNWDYWEDLDESLLPEGMTKELYAGRLASEYPEPEFIVYKGLWNSSDAQNVYYAGTGPCIISYSDYWTEAVATKGVDEETQIKIDFDNRFTQAINNSLQMLPEVSVQNSLLKYTVEEAEPTTDARAALSKYVTESIGAFLTGQWDIDTYWDTYLAELDKIGIDQVLEFWQMAYDRSK